MNLNLEQRKLKSHSINYDLDLERVINVLEKSGVSRFNTFGISDFKIVHNKYVKYKRAGRWYKNQIANFDRYRKPTYKKLEWLMKELFNEVEKVSVEVPLVVNDNGNLYYLSSKTIVDNKALYVTKLLPIFFKRYPESTSCKIISVYLGGHLVYHHYEDENKTETKSSEYLLSDIIRMHDIILRNKFSRAEIAQFVRVYYPDIFPKVPILQPRISAQPVKPTVSLAVETKEEQKAPKRLKEIKPKISRAKRVRRRKVKKLEEKLPSFDDIRKKPYAEVTKIISKYNPPTVDFFGRVGKIYYENSLARVRDEDRKREMDYVYAWFIECSKMKGRTTKEILTEFRRRLEKKSLKF